MMAIFPFLSALVGAFLILVCPVSLSRPLALILAILRLLVSCWFVFQCASGTHFVALMGNWSAPFGITLVIDLLASLMLVATDLILLSTLSYFIAEQSQIKEHPFRLPLLFFLLTGISLSLTTGDFFNLFVAFELMLLSSYSLMTLETHRENLPDVFPYVGMNLLGSTFFVVGAAIIYDFTGTLNFATISQFFAVHLDDPHLWVIVGLIITVIGMKAGIFPLYFWLPNSYPALPASLAAFYGGTLTKVGVYLLMRLFVTVLPHDLPTAHNLLLILSGFTMLIGVFGAISKTHIKCILSYHIVSQVGYMVFAIALFHPLALAASLYFTLHNMMVKTSLFLIGGIAEKCYRTDRLKEMGHLWGMIPLVGCAFLIQAFSLAGFPPFSGFFGKFWILHEGLSHQQYLLTVIALITGWFTLYSMLKIWMGAFWGSQKSAFNADTVPHCRLLVATSPLILATLAMSLFAPTAINLTQRASETLFQRTPYIENVLNTKGRP
ncbi:MAG: hypothetical protein KDK65_00570 [Chlamydiia bacterium]|nr:hypothetical protein [Chlamydiia bacterium]